VAGVRSWPGRVHLGEASANISGGRFRGLQPPPYGRLVGFPAAFPWFNTQRYREERIRELREQVAAMDQPPHAA
jgi:hypothetical protein